MENYFLVFERTLQADLFSSTSLLDAQCFFSGMPPPDGFFLVHQVNYSTKRKSTHFEYAGATHSLRHDYNARVATSLQFSLDGMNQFVNDACLNAGVHRSRITAFSINNTAVFLKEPVDVRDLPANDVIYAYHTQSLKNAARNICVDLRKNITSSACPDDMARTVQATYTILDTLYYHYLGDIKPKSLRELYPCPDRCDRTDILKLGFSILRELLGAIERDYPMLLDTAVRNASRLVLLGASEIESKLCATTLALSECDIDPKLILIVTEPVNHFVNPHHDQRITYGDYSYIMHFLDAFFDEIIAGHSLTNACVIRLLTSLNCNVPKFFNYVTASIREELESCTSFAERLTVLYTHRRNFNQMIIKSQRRYLHDYPDVRSQVICWLDEEIQYMNTSQALETMLCENKNNTRENVTPPVAAKRKIKTASSVQQLSLFFKTMVETEFLLHDNHHDIFRFIADNFRTAQVNDISLDSIRSKYYATETTALLAVKKQLEKMLKAIEQKLTLS